MFFYRLRHKEICGGGFLICLLLEGTPLLGEMSQTEGSAVSGEEKVPHDRMVAADEVFML